MVYLCHVAMYFKKLDFDVGPMQARAALVMHSLLGAWTPWTTLAIVHQLRTSVSVKRVRRIQAVSLKSSAKVSAARSRTGEGCKVNYILHSTQPNPTQLTYYIRKM